MHRAAVKMRVSHRRQQIVKPATTFPLGVSAWITHSHLFRGLLHVLGGAALCLLGALSVGFNCEWLEWLLQCLWYCSPAFVFERLQWYRVAFFVSLLSLVHPVYAVAENTTAMATAVTITEAVTTFALALGFIQRRREAQLNSHIEIMLYTAESIDRLPLRTLKNVSALLKLPGKIFVHAGTPVDPDQLAQLQTLVSNAIARRSSRSSKKRCDRSETCSAQPTKRSRTEPSASQLQASHTHIVPLRMLGLDELKRLDGTTLRGLLTIVQRADVGFVHANTRGPIGEGRLQHYRIRINRALIFVCTPCIKNYDKRELLSMPGERLSQIHAQITTPGVRLRTVDGKQYLSGNALNNLVARVCKALDERSAVQLQFHTLPQLCRMPSDEVQQLLTLVQSNTRFISQKTKKKITSHTIERFQSRIQQALDLDGCTSMSDHPSVSCFKIWSSTSPRGLALRPSRR